MEGTNPLMESEEAFPSQAAFESLAKRRGSEKRIRKFGILFFPVPIRNHLKVEVAGVQRFQFFIPCRPFRKEGLVQRLIDFDHLCR